jgi:branched-subunit amino acid ABC-type transport system permease component
VTEAFGASIVGPQYRDLVVFGIFVLVLVIKPEGLSSVFHNLKIPAVLRKSASNEE